MNAVNAVLRAIVAAVLAPLAALPAWVGLVLIAALLGVAAAAAFRYVSNQTALRRVADQMRANLLALWLFRHDVRASLQAQGGLLAASLKRLLWSLVPLAVLAPPFVLILAHMAMWYEFRPFRAGETALVEMRLTPEGWTKSDNGSAVELKPLAGDLVEARVRGNADRSITWRVRVQEPSPQSVLGWSLPGGVMIEKRFATAADDGRLTFAPPLRPGGNFWDRVLYPGEPAFDAASMVQSISINQPRRSTPIFGFDIPWWLTFFVVSILAALAAKPFLKVQF